MFDSDQEFFDCPFCGNKYDIIDFHADEVLSQARSCLEQKSFAAAKEKFDQVLDNDPKNFDALLGTVLCALNLTSVDELDDDENLTGCNLIEAKKALINAKRLSVNEKAEYFSKFIEVIENREKTVKVQKEKNELLSGGTKEQINSKMVANYQENRSRDRGSLPWFWILMGGCVLLAVVVGLAEMTENPGTMITAFVGFFAIIGVIIYAVRKRDAEHDTKYKPANHYESTLDSNIGECQRAYVIANKEMKEIYASIAADKKASASEADSAPVAASDIDSEQDISCAKCGAKLKLDKIKRVYECDHCGVAYGVSLFFGLPMEKALNSLNTGDYTDAEQRFSHLLMVNPSDFESLLGRILCAGKWTKVSDIKLSADYESSEINAIRECIYEAVRKADEKDRQFFMSLCDLIDFFEPYSKKSKVLESQNKAVSDMESKADVLATAYAGANYNSNYKKERQELVSRTYPTQVELKKLEGDFAKLRKNLIAARGECRLV